MVINGVQTHINGLGLVGNWVFFTPVSGVITVYLQLEGAHLIGYNHSKTPRKL